MGVLDGVHTGVVKTTRPSDRMGIPYGYIKDDNPLVGTLFFRNFGGIFEIGDAVAYRAKPADPKPVAYGLLKKDEIYELVHQQSMPLR